MTISDDAANPADFEWTNARFVRILVRKTHLLRHLIPKMRSFYQDMLGTNIGKTQNERCIFRRRWSCSCAWWRWRPRSRTTSTTATLWPSKQCSHRGGRSWCEKRHFLSHICIKCIILPRQARDKHSNIGKTQKRVAFFLGPRLVAAGVCVAGRVLLRPWRSAPPQRAAQQRPAVESERGEQRRRRRRRRRQQREDR